MKMGTFGKMLLGCYLLLFVLFLGNGVYQFFYDSARPPTKLSPEKAGLVEVEQEEDGLYRILGPDGQLRFEHLALTGRRLVLQGEFAQNPGELDLYYKKEGQEKYSVNQRVFARPLQSGGYEYILPAGTYTGLRLDTGTEPGNTLLVEEITFNKPLPVYGYFLPSLRGLMVFLALPALASCVIYTIMEWYRYCISKRRQAPAGKGQDE